MGSGTSGSVAAVSKEGGDEDGCPGKSLWHPTDHSLLRPLLLLDTTEAIADLP